MRKAPKAKRALRKFLTEKVSADPKAFAKFTTDLATFAKLRDEISAALSKSGLTKAHQEILLSGDQEKIRRAVGEDFEPPWVGGGLAKPGWFGVMASVGGGAKKAKKSLGE